MRRVIAGLLMAVLMPLAAMAGDCVQADGVEGWYNGTTADDAGCITEAEYAEMYSVANLADLGIVTVVADNGDGTVTVDHAIGGSGILIADPLERPVAANTNPESPAFEGDAPTVREVLWTVNESTGFVIPA